MVRVLEAVGRKGDGPHEDVDEWIDEEEAELALDGEVALVECASCC